MRELIDKAVIADITLSHEEVQRYSRHLIMPEVGAEGQKKLKASSVLLIGAGGLGSPLGMYLAAAGIGRIGMVDYDVVDYTNLQRQIIHGTKDELIPYSHSVKLAEIYGDPSILTTVEGSGHNNLISFEAFHNALDKLLK